MSKVKIQGDASGSGIFTIAAPNSNTDRTLTLPDEAGTVLTSASDVASSQIATALNASGSAPLYACRAWVNFDGTTGPVTIRASGNVSSITDIGVGAYQVNFTTAMPDANFCTNVVCDPVQSNAASAFVENSNTTTKTLVYYILPGTALYDASQMSVSVFR